MGNSHKDDKCLHNDSRAIKGLSVIEVLVGLLLAGMIGFALYEVDASQERVYSVQDDISEVQQNLRVGLEKISRDLTIAGLGRPASISVNGTNLSSWYSKNNSTSGGFEWFPVYAPSGTSALEIIGCLQGDADGTIASMTNGAGTTLTLEQEASVASAHFNTSSMSDLSIAGAENAKVASVSGNQLVLDRTLTNTYGAGTPIYVVRRRTYSTGTDAGVPVLTLNDNRGSGSQSFCQWITGLQTQVAGNTVTVVLTGRTRNRDRLTNQYMTMSASAKVLLRNPVGGNPWP
jgi:hypothetical protein